MTPEQPHPELEQDIRLYVLEPENWQARVKQDWEKEYCYQKNPGEDYFHRLVAGEVFFQREDERYCLNCALRRGIVTYDRLNWQHGTKKSRTNFPI